jgi:Mn2+/Fe2+ NRAMP family transporter
MLLIIGIVGTTVAPWQLFFQQSYVIDKRITPRFMNYEKVDLWIGILMVIVGAAAIIGFTSATFTGRPEFGNFTDALGVAEGLGKFVGPGVGVMFAIALIDASIIGAAAVGLSTSYALGDVLGLKHSLHRKPWEAKGFYAVFAALLGLAATIVLIPGAPLGLLTVGVQTRRGAATFSHGLPLVALQRQRRAGPLGQRQMVEPVHVCCRRRAGHAFHHPHSQRSLPRHHGRDNLVHPRRGQRLGNSCRSDCPGPSPATPGR